MNEKELWDNILELIGSGIQIREFTQREYNNLLESGAGGKYLSDHIKPIVINNTLAPIFLDKLSESINAYVSQFYTDIKHMSREDFKDLIFSRYSEVQSILSHTDKNPFRADIQSEKVKSHYFDQCHSQILQLHEKIKEVGLYRNIAVQILAKFTVSRDLNKLYDELDGYIDCQNLSKKEFKSALVDETFSKKIDWIGGSREFKYFADNLCKNQYVSYQSRKKDETLANCFTIDGKEKTKKQIHDLANSGLSDDAKVEFPQCLGQV